MWIDFYKDSGGNFLNLPPEYKTSLHPASAVAVIVLALSVCVCVCVSVRPSILPSQYPGQTHAQTDRKFGI